MIIGSILERLKVAMNSKNAMLERQRDGARLSMLIRSSEVKSLLDFRGVSDSL